MKKLPIKNVGIKRKDAINPNTKKPFKVKPKSSPFRPGIDQEKLNQVVDDVLSEDFK